VFGACEAYFSALQFSHCPPPPLLSDNIASTAREVVKQLVHEEAKLQDGAREKVDEQTSENEKISGGVLSNPSPPRGTHRHHGFRPRAAPCVQPAQRP
jgi:hypothetical protein